MAYQKITDEYEKYSLRSYITDVVGWSEDAINLYDLGNVHVVFENRFIEPFKGVFLSNSSRGKAAQMQQLQGGMNAVRKGFLKPHSKKGIDDSLLNNITFGARVKRSVSVG